MSGAREIAYEALQLFALAPRSGERGQGEGPPARLALLGSVFRAQLRQAFGDLSFVA